MVTVRSVSGRLPTDTELMSGVAGIHAERACRSRLSAWAAGGGPVNLCTVSTVVRTSMIGVVPDVRNLALDRDPDGQFYYPMAIDRKPSAGKPSGHEWRRWGQRARCGHVGHRRSASGVSRAFSRHHVDGARRFGAPAEFSDDVLRVIRRRGRRHRRRRRTWVSSRWSRPPDARGQCMEWRWAHGHRRSRASSFSRTCHGVSGLAAGHVLIVVMGRWFGAQLSLQGDAYRSAPIWLAAIAVLLATAGLGAFLPARRASRTSIRSRRSRVE